MSFEDDLKAAQAAPIEFADVELEINGKLQTLRFLQLAGAEWVAEADKHPARPGILIDDKYGYNLRTLSPVIAKRTGRRLDGNPKDPNVTLVTLTPEQWDDLFRTLNGNARGRIDDAIWGLNEIGPLVRVNELKKASEVASQATSD